jgi:tetratricopeptide (TPR) repeat protein
MISSIRVARATGLLALLALILAFAPLSAARAAASGPEAAIVAFGLFGDQTVFESEAKGAAKVLAARFGGDHVIVRSNTKTREDATPDTLASALQTAAGSLNPDNDVLFLLLTSHGSPAGVALKTPRHQGILSPLDLAIALEKAPVRHRVVVVSACYSGVFIPLLADPDTLIITAADAHHPSFGCQNGAEWTYFGDAFFNMALRRTGNLREAFALASAAVRKRELQNGFDPSNPQLAGGENVERMLAGGGAEQREAGRDPRYAAAHISRGDAYDARGDTAHALAEYDRAIGFDPRNALAYSKRSIEERSQGDLKTALADSDEAIRLDAKLAFAYNGRGMIQYAVGDKERAIADFDTAIRLDPKLVSGYNNRAFAYASMGDNDRAIADYSEAVRLDPQYFVAYNNRGLAYRARGDNDRAIADFSRAIKLAPRFVRAYENRALAYRAKGDNGRAVADLNEASRLKTPGTAR